jgi:hypothetical protein
VIKITIGVFTHHVSDLPRHILPAVCPQAFPETLKMFLPNPHVGTPHLQSCDQLQNVLRIFKEHCLCTPGKPFRYTGGGGNNNRNASANGLLNIQAVRFVPDRANEQVDGRKKIPYRIRKAQESNTFGKAVHTNSLFPMYKAIAGPGY